MVTFNWSRVDRKAQGPLDLEFYLFPFGPTLSHMLKLNWNGPKGWPKRLAQLDNQLYICKGRNIQNHMYVVFH